jgi:hypothetical protein
MINTTQQIDRSIGTALLSRQPLPDRSCTKQDRQNPLNEYVRPPGHCLVGDAGGVRAARF